MIAVPSPLITVRNVVVGIVLAIVLSVLVYVAVLVVAAAFVEPTVATGEDSAAPIAEDVGPLGLEIIEGEGSDSAVPIAP